MTIPDWGNQWNYWGKGQYGEYKVKIHKGKPSKEDWEEIHKMIDQGYHTGIDKPIGITWEIIWR